MPKRHTWISMYMVLLIGIAPALAKDPVCTIYSTTYCPKNLSVGLGKSFLENQTEKESFMHENRPIFPIVFEDEPEFMWELKKSLILPGATHIPETILIGKDGNMITRFNGWDPKTTPALVYKEILNALKSQPKATTLNN